MGRIYEATKAWLATTGWRFMEHPERSYVAFPCQGRHALWQCYAMANEERERFVFHAVAAVRAPEAARLEVAEYITRVNYRVLLGNFYLDFSDGEIGYKTSFATDGVDDPTSLLAPTVFANLHTADRFFPGLTAVMYGGSTPQQAVELVLSASC